MAGREVGGMNSKALWYLTRGSGIVSLILLTLAVLAGLLTVGRWSNRRWPRFVVEGLHRNLSLLAPVFLVIHIASSVLDSYVSIKWINAVVPFGASYKPFWLGLGALSLDAFIALIVTSLIRARLGYRGWRAVHWVAYGCFGLAVVHGLGIGSDRHQPWFLAINLAAVASVGLAVAWRVAGALRHPPAVALAPSTRTVSPTGRGAALTKGAFR
jgi:predicted ferric reductase